MNSEIDETKPFFLRGVSKSKPIVKSGSKTFRVRTYMSIKQRRPTPDAFLIQDMSHTMLQYASKRFLEGS